MARPLDWLTRGGDGGATPPRPLSHLVGTTRAAAPDAIGSGLNTTRPAAAIGLFPPIVSRHATVLREAGPIASERRGQSVPHVRTDLGTAS